MGFDLAASQERYRKGQHLFGILRKTDQTIFNPIFWESVADGDSAHAHRNIFRQDVYSLRADHAEQVSDMPKRYFETAIDNDKCYKNPVKRLKPTSKKHSAEKRVYTREERDELFEACKDYADGLIIYLLLEFGLRCSELCALRWEDFDFAAKTLHVQRASVIVQGEVTVGEPKKQDQQPHIAYARKLSGVFAARAGSGYIFPSRNGLPYTSKTFAHVRYDPLMEEIRRDHPNIPKLTMHEPGTHAARYCMTAQKTSMPCPNTWGILPCA